ncbi:LOW QUALITY PROTEIN: ATP-dependent RNA helicase DDX54-like [Pollicipes pollicipes]|uniref:LOW QUALITY PROTEIN: ATP-dependent RNA helicase DDX54-like n=1 Tax=Pollicipes pollicipes TaxID=41117 RepID=UPI001885061C|nr:LOW QUALITY PROTEIN: ATP-dependent RNA helicase DDX54-like [Pollicipes pollicipes]
MKPRKKEKTFGFDDEQPDGFVSDAEEVDTRRLVAEQNKKKRKSGGFQSMGFSNSVYKGIVKRGYKIPTPIQRKCIPVILEGKDVVAMARTGSGKTACFLLPMLEKLQVASAMSGARALVLSPTRELALQTLRFTKELGRFSNLRAAAVLGGDSMEGQFSALHEKPDIIIATPGRFVHVCVEMELRLDAVEYVVFDEADRLFEMGFAEQLREILARLPDARQTLLFSATLPGMLVEFARAGLTDPVLVRLDVETKLSEQLSLAYLRCRDDERSLLLLHLLENVVPAGQQTVVFAATKHHVEYIRLLLERAGLSCTFLYSDLDPAARKINTDKFRHKRVNVLVVTDVAARGIDIPHLDNVINYNFPAKPKLFVHRVGRVARAGRPGTAYSILIHNELPYLLDLYLFLGSKLTFTPSTNLDKEVNWHGYLGSIPQELVDVDSERIQLWHDTSNDLRAALKSSQNAFKQYLRSRPAASAASVRRMRRRRPGQLGVHPVLRPAGATAGADERARLIDAVRGYKASRTIFEVGVTSHQNSAKVMKAKRNRDEHVIERAVAKRKAAELEDGDEQQEAPEPEPERVPLAASSEQAISDTFQRVVRDRQKYDRRREQRAKRPRPAAAARDEQNYIPYQAKDHHTEAGYSVTSAFEREASTALLDLAMDDDTRHRRQANAKHWDPKKKKYVGNSNDGKNKKIRTESGVWIPATFQKAGKYDEWKKKTQLDAQDSDSDEGHQRKGGRGLKVIRHRKNQSRPALGGGPAHAKRPEMRSSDQILKQRDLTERRRNRSTVGVGKGRGGKSRGGKAGGEMDDIHASRVEVVQT